MLPNLYSLGSMFIQVLVALIITGHGVAALVSLWSNREVEQARLIVAEGTLTGLGFLLAATLLRTIQLRTWSEIFVFTIIFALRFVLKRLFVWEQSRIMARVLLRKLT